MGQDNVELIAEGHSALECVTNWLRDDNHGFVIPDTEWGQCLYSALGELVAALERVTPREVTTVAELNALPDGAVIRWDSGVDFVTAERYYRLWMPAGTDGTLDSADITLPATVLFTPTGKETE